MRLHWWTVGLLLAARVAAAESRLPAGLEDLFTRWVTVTADEIERSGATTLEEYLVRLPYFTGGGFGRFDVADGAGRAVADLRFLSPQRTLVLIDGHRSVGTRGVVDLNSIPLSAVERVEIDLRSSQATAGPEAIAGVINIVTRDPIGARAGLMSGITPDTDGEQLLTAVSIGDERWSVSAQYLLRRELGADQTRWDAGRLETFGALGSGSWALGEGVELYLDSQFNQRASRQRLLPELIDSERGTAPLFLAQDASTFRILTGVAGRLGDWSMDVFTGGGQSNVALETRNSVDTLDDELSIELARESETQFMLGGDFAGPLFELPAGAADLRLGFLFRDERWVERGGGGDRTGGFDAFEVFGGLVAPVVTGAEISVAGRLSDFSSVGNVFAYEVRGSHQPLDGLQLRLGFGRGLRAPNTNELYAGVAERTLSAFDPCEVAVSVEACRADGRPSGAPLGNPLLEPEIHRFFEGGLALTLPVVPGFELSLSTDVYNTQIDEAVRVDPESGSLVNDGRLESSGFDLRADLHFDFPANSAASHLDLGWQMDYL
ncbi:MAG: TonB-dependent receptor, partial [Myxococcota bacterium]